MKDNILTDRLSLKILTEHDHEFILLLLNSKGWLEFIGDRHVHTKEESIAYIQKILSTPNLYYWVVRKQDNHIPVGIITFIKREYLDHFDIGFAFLPEFNKYGFAFESSEAILNLVTQDPNHQTVLATTKPDNSTSIKLLLKLGFDFEKQLTINDEVLHLYSFVKAYI